MLAGNLSTLIIIGLAVTGSKFTKYNVTYILKFCKTFFKDKGKNNLITEKLLVLILNQIPTTIFTNK